MLYLMIAFLGVVILIAVEYLISLKINVLVAGAIIPAFMLGLTIYLFAMDWFELSFVTLIPFVALIIAVMGVWLDGRLKRKEK